MSNNIQKELGQLKENAKRDLERIAELEKMLQEPEQWEPSGGSPSVGGHGDPYVGSHSFEKHRLFGNEFQTVEQAEWARDRMRLHNLQMKYRLDHATDWKEDWEDRNQKKSYVYYDHNSKTYLASTNYWCQDLSGIYFPTWLAEQLCEALNEGRCKIIDDAFKALRGGV